jgi:hypothetical protein
MNKFQREIPKLKAIKIEFQIPIDMKLLEFGIYFFAI